MLLQPPAEPAKTRSRQVPLQAIESGNPFHAAQPSQLPLRQLARGGDAFLAQLRQIEFSVQVLPSLAIADTAHRRQGRIERIIPPQLLHLVEQALRQHNVETLGNALVQHGTVARQQSQGMEDRKSTRLNS